MDAEAARLLRTASTNNQHRKIMQIASIIKPQPIPQDNRFKDLTGKTFGKFLVRFFAGRDKHGNRLWLCQCKCGNQAVVAASSLSRGTSTSCGCFVKEVVSRMMKTHGMSETIEYTIWGGMKSRCKNKNNLAYHRYGGRGIKVCDRWIHSFENFLADMSECPLGLTLERIDVDGNYEPSNCRWATMTEQANNRRTNTKITFEGITQTVAQWSKQKRISQSTISARIKAGWSLKKVFETPVRLLKRLV